jgi:hypothetical protein
MKSRTGNSILLCVLFICISVIATALPPADCLQTRFEKEAQSISERLPVSVLVVANHCGKAVTAYSIIFYDAADKQLGELNVDVIARLALKQKGEDILRPKQSMTVQHDTGSPEQVVTRTAAVLYDDGSAAGSEERALQLIGNRKKALLEAEERLREVTSVADFREAGKLRERAASVKTARPNLAPYLERLADRERVSDAETWGAFVSREREYYEALIKVYKDNLSYSN